MNRLSQKAETSHPPPILMPARAEVKLVAGSV